MEKFYEFYLEFKKYILSGAGVFLGLFFMLPFICTNRVGRDEECVSKDDVALYIINYHELPKNYITMYGYDTGIMHGDVNGKIIGGDTHWNNGDLEDFGIDIYTSLKECDIAGEDYRLLKGRGIQRLVYTTNEDDVRVFYTDDHYQTYEEITGFYLQMPRNILWIIWSLLTTGTVGGGVALEAYGKKRKDDDTPLLEEPKDGD